MLLRSAKLQHGKGPHPVSTIALSSGLSHLAVGLADGTVLFFRQLDQYIFSNSTSLTSLPKPKIIHESPDEPITGLGFREPQENDDHGADHLYLFIVTISHVLSYQVTGKGSGLPPVVVDEVGCGLGCAEMNQKAQDMIIARDEAIYFATVDGRGPCIAFEGPKTSILTHKNYLVIVSPPFAPNAGSASATVRRFVAKTPGVVGSGVDISKVTVFDVENKLVAYSNTFKQIVKDVFSCWGQLFVLTNNGTVSSNLRQSLIFSYLCYSYSDWTKVTCRKS